jgi:hypothetical protein
MGQRPTFEGGGPVTYRLWCARKPATQSVPYSQAMWDCQGPRYLFPGAPPVPGALTSTVGVRVDYRELPGNLAAPPLAGCNTKRWWNAQISRRLGWLGNLA